MKTVITIEIEHGKTTSKNAETVALESTSLEHYVTQLIEAQAFELNRATVERVRVFTCRVSGVMAEFQTPALDRRKADR